MSDEKPVSRLSLFDLKDGIAPGVTAAKGTSLAEAACVCLHRAGHGMGVMMPMDGVVEKIYEMQWECPSQQMCNCYNDEENATEDAAYAVSFLTVLDATDYTVIRKSRKGTGFDWFLAHRDQAFQGAARLEVSGLRRGSESQIDTRVRQKLRQTNRSDDSCLPAYVSVTEFGSPRTRLVKKS